MRIINAMFNHKPKIRKSLFRLLTGFIVGSAVGSILGLTLAPKKGKESREYLREQSMKMFLKGKEYIQEEKKVGLFKRLLIKLLSSKKHED